MASSRWGVTPRESVTALSRARGNDYVVRQCKRILDEQNFDESVLAQFAGPIADYVLSGHEGGVDGYWPRVWALRALLYAWDESARAQVVAASRHEAWRVREMCARVCAKHEIEEALDALNVLTEDETPRVRIAAQKAIEVILSR